MVMLRAAIAVCGVGDVESVAVTVKFATPPTVGVPEITPVAAFKTKPRGRAPDVMAQDKGKTAPTACNV